MPLRVLLLATLISSNLFARVDEPTPLCDPNRLISSESIDNIVALSNNIMESNCPNPGRMDRLCQAISFRAIDTTPDTDFTYVYQRTVYEASCVDYNSDSDEDIARKVSLMWARYGADLRCGPMGVPATGSPLRFAIHNSFEDFITDALSLWRIDLNRIENNQTMLDFLDERISRSNGLLKQNLERYRGHFIRAGAKKRSEL